MTTITRRSFLQTGTAALGAAALWNAGAAAGLGQEGAPTRGGKLVIRRSSAWTTMDAHLATNADPDYPLMFDYLTQYVRNDEGQFEVQPGLAESWTFVDDLTIDFTVRADVAFHDGTPLDADVVAWNIERMRSHEKSGAKIQTAGIVKVEALDARIVRVTLDKPNAALLVNLSSAADSVTAILSKAHVEAVGDEKAALEPVGTGPFRFVSWTPNGSVKWERWDKYWMAGVDGQPLPYPDTVESVLQANDQTALLRLRSGDIHIVDGILGSQLPILNRERNVELIQTPWQSNIFTLVFNAREGARFAGDAQRALRHGIFAAIDSEAVARAVGQGLGIAAWSPLVEGQVGYSAGVNRHAYDPDKARALLAEAGVTERLAIPVDIISRQDDVAVAQLYQQMLAQVGIDLEIRPQDRVAWASKIRASEFELASFFGRGRPDADGALSTFLSASGRTNYAGVNDPAIEDLLDRGRSTYDDAERQAIYEELQNLVQDQGYYNFVWNRTGAVAISKNIRGFVPPFFGTISDSTTVSIES